MNKTFLLTSLIVFTTLFAGCAKNTSSIDYAAAFSENGVTRFEVSNESISENSVFELASNGKVLAAYIAFKLIDEGKLSLNTQIAQYLDSSYLTSDPQMQEITVYELLNHSAGFSPSYEFGIDKKIYTVPGEKFRYSGVGYMYLQNVLENVTQKSFEALALEYVFVPLKMENSTFEKSKTVLPHMELSNVLLYSSLIFFAVYWLLRLIITITGCCITRPVRKSKKLNLLCIADSAGCNVCFVMIFLFSRVLFVFGIILLLSVILLICLRNTKFYSYIMPVITAVFCILVLTVHQPIAVTNDFYTKPANCAYSLKSTAKDMSLFCDELMKCNNNSNSKVQELFSESMRINDSLSWGNGIGIETHNGTRVFWHSGFNFGFQSLFALCPDTQKYAIVLTNNEQGFSLCTHKINEYLSLTGVYEIPR